MLKFDWLKPNTQCINMDRFKKSWKLHSWSKWSRVSCCHCADPCVLCSLGCRVWMTGVWRDSALFPSLIVTAPVSRLIELTAIARHETRTQQATGDLCPCFVETLKSMLRHFRFFFSLTFIIWTMRFKWFSLFCSILTNKMIKSKLNQLLFRKKNT